MIGPLFWKSVLGLSAKSGDLSLLMNFAMCPEITPHDSRPHQAAGGSA